MTPDSEKSPPGEAPSYKPTLQDQHWRALLSRQKPEELDKDMTAAIEMNDRWRFSMLLQLNRDWSGKDDLLRRTIEFGRMEMFEAMTKGGLTLTSYNGPQSLAGYAAEAGRLDFLKLFVEKHGVDVHYYSDELIRNASRHGHEDVVEYLLSKGADHSAWGGDPMREACDNGHLGVVKKLVAAGAEIGNALDRAAANGKKDIVEYLLSKGTEADTHLGDAFTSASRGGHADVVALLLTHGVSVSAGDNEAFVAACDNKHFAVAQLLLTHGADVNAQHGKPLRNASSRGEAETVKFLLENKANPNVAGTYRETPLIEAARAGHAGIVKSLLRHGADPAMFGFEAWKVARREKKRDMQLAIIKGARAARVQEADDRLAEFDATFKGGYSLDDLRTQKGPSGNTGLMLAARSGKFAAIVRKATGGQLLPSDLFHPDDQLDSVMTVLVKTKTLQQFFDPAFWADRTGAVSDAYESLPAAFQKRVKLDSIRAQINHRVIMQKAKGAGGGLKPNKPPKIPGY
ncbi:MAG: ankyrin repeat domain-containing protein [Alphaproteobacteria bacterium]